MYVLIVLCDATASGDYTLKIKREFLLGEGHFERKLHFV